MSFDFSLIWNSLPLLLAGAGVTIAVSYTHLRAHET